MKTHTHTLLALLQFLSFTFPLKFFFFLLLLLSKQKPPQSTNDPYPRAEKTHWVRQTLPNM